MALLHIFFLFVIIRIPLGNHLVAIKERGAIKSAKSSKWMHANKKSTIGDVRKFIQTETRRVPGQIWLGTKQLYDFVPLSSEPIFDNPHAVIEYEVSSIIILNGSLRFITPSGVKEKHIISLNITVGINHFFSDIAAQIKRSLGSKDKWFGKQVIHYKEGPMLFVFRNCRNDYVLIRDFPHGCTVFKISHEIKKLNTMTNENRGQLSNNIRDVVMLKELFDVKLTARDVLVWIPTKPIKTKPVGAIVKRVNCSYYGQDFYVFTVDIAKHGAFTLHLQNIKTNTFNTNPKIISQISEAKHHYKTKPKKTVPGPVKRICCSVQ